MAEQDRSGLVKCRKTVVDWPSTPSGRTSPPKAYNPCSRKDDDDDDDDGTRASHNPNSGTLASTAQHTESIIPDLSNIVKIAKEGGAFHFWGKG